jgi:hypothetical protein
VIGCHEREPCDEQRDAGDDREDDADHANDDQRDAGAHAEHAPPALPQRRQALSGQELEACHALLG